MVMNQFPMFRLATLLARQLSSPLATRIKSFAISNPRVGAAVCVNIAQAFSACEWRARALSLRLAGVRLPRRARPPPLALNAAIELGGNLLGEAIMFALGSLIVIFEVNRQATNKDLKELEEQSQWLAILLSLQELQHEVRLQQLDLERLHAALMEYQLHRNEKQQDEDSTQEHKLPNT